MFSRENEDDEEFFPNPKTKTKLSTLFTNNTNVGDSSLTYTAPKQPKTQNKATPRVQPSTQPASSTSSVVIVAKTVQTFKMEASGSYQSQGKLGAAVVSSCVNNETTFQLYVYRDKRTHLCTVRIHRDFKFLIQPKCYASFYDKSIGIWAVLFDSSADMVEFTLQVAQARWKAGDSTTPLMIQDLWCPETSDGEAEVGDNVELMYTIHKLGMTSEMGEESLNINVNVEESGWKQALVGIKPLSKRVIILQPFMLGDLNPREVGYNSPVVVILTVVQVSKGTTKPQALTKQLLTDSPQPQPDTSDGPAEGPKTTKADIINRMARMGQALPFRAVGPTPSDSDETEEDLSGRLRNAVPRPRTRQHHTTPSVVASVPPPLSEPVGPVVAATIASPMTMMSHPMVMAQPYMMGTMYPQADSQAQFNMFVSEVRTTNSELRMGITRLSDKVDALDSKVDNREKSENNQEMMSLMERLLQHEQQLKDQLQIVISSVQNSQVPRNGVSAVQSASSMSDSDHSPPTSSTSAVSVVNHGSVSSQPTETQAVLSERIKKLEEENEFLKTTSDAQKAVLQNARLADQDQLKRIEELQKQVNEERLKVTELNERLETAQAEKNTLKEDIGKKINSLAELQKTVLEKQICIDRLEQAVTASEARTMEEVRSNLKEVLDQKQIVEEHAKKIFNRVYRLVKMQLEPQTSYTGTFIYSVLAETIKGVTLEYLQNGDISSQQRKPPEESSNSTPEPVPSTSFADQASDGKYMRKELREARPLVANLTDSSEGESRTQQEDINTPETREELHVIADNTERFNQFDSSTSVEEGSEGSKLQVTTTTSTDVEAPVWKPQPPPPPLFDDEENDDAWLNS